MTIRKLTLSRAERKARFLELQEQAFDLLHPRDDGAEPEVFSTEAQELWPRRARTKRHARDLIRQVPGHERHGRGKDTTWSVDAELFRRHHTKRPLLKTVPEEATPSALSDEEIADRAFANADVRSTKRRIA